MSLKDAMEKAGLKSTKSANERKVIKGREVAQSEKHQQSRNFCEVCQLIQPDVERFKHRMPTIDAEWICAACADREQLDDKFRITHQSEFAKSGRFRREFGATKPASEFGSIKRPTKKHHKGQSRRTQPQKAQRSTDDNGEKNFNR